MDARSVPLPLQKALESYRSMLAQRFGPRLKKVSLFGSWARGEQGPESDIDVFVCISGADWREEREAAMMAGDISVAHDLWLSPIIYSEDRFDRLVRIESPFARSVLREEIVL